MNPALIGLIAKLGLEYGPAILSLVYKHREGILRAIEALTPAAVDAVQHGIPLADKAHQILVAVGGSLAAADVTQQTAAAQERASGPAGG